MPEQVLAILWAQGRSLVRFRRGGGVAFAILSVLPLVFWYALWILFSLLAFYYTSSAASARPLKVILTNGLMFVFFYWQLTPILAASMGASLDLKKLLAYPIPHGQLFVAEVLLRLTAGAEMLLLLAGTVAGLLWNPVSPGMTAPGAMLLFALFNLFLSAGLRHQLERLIARKRFRQVAVLVLVMSAAVPQLLMLTKTSFPLGRWIVAEQATWWPWTVAARASLGDNAPAAFGLLSLWVLAAYWFGRWQFERSLKFDASAVQSQERRASRVGMAMERFYRLPSLLLPDPLGAVTEKELRSLSRTPRSRMVFLMGFTFGIMMFLPMAWRAGQKGTSAIAHDYLAIVGAYALLLLGDVAFWNVFGFDRAAAQVYFLLPVSISRVLAGKNLAAAVFVVLEITGVAVVWKLIRMPVPPMKVLEAYAVTLTLTPYLLGAGNLSSVHFPQPADPERATGAVSSGRLRALLLLIYPFAALPVLLAYGSRYAFDSDIAFWLVLAFGAALGAVIYWLALESAVARAEQRREQMVQALCEGQGPVVL
jgi:ABC-2 type transport system permease protein